MPTATVARATYAPTASVGSRYSARMLTELEKARMNAELGKLAARVLANLREISDKRELSLYAIANKCGISPSTFYKLRSSTRGVGIDMLYRLHRGLGLSADQFLDDDPPEKYWRPTAEEGRRGRRRDGMDAAAEGLRKVKAELERKTAEIVKTGKKARGSGG